MHRKRVVTTIVLPLWECPDENSTLDHYIQKKLEDTGRIPIVMTSPIVRMYFRKLSEESFPDLVVISYNEVDTNIKIQSVGMITA